MELLIILAGVLLAYEIYNVIAWKNCVRKLKTYAHPSSPNTLFIFNSSFRIEKAINYAIPVSDYHQEELIQVSLWNIFPSLTVKLLFDAYKKALLNNQIERVEFTMYEEGKAKKFQAQFIPLRNGRIGCLIDYFPLPAIEEAEQVYEAQGTYQELGPVGSAKPIPQPAF